MKVLPQEKIEAIIAYWVDHPTSTYRSIAENVGIDEDYFYRLRQQPAFMELYHKRCKEWFAALEAKAVANLEAKLNENDWQATKYALDAMDYAPKQKVDLSTESTITISIEE